MVVMDALGQCGLFADLAPEVVDRVSAIAQVERYAEGATIFRENDHATDIFILTSGRVALSFSFPHQGKVLHVGITTIRPGQVFGWSALTSYRDLSAQADAELDSEVTRLPGAALRELMDDDPLLGYRVMDYLTNLSAGRLRDSRERLRTLLQWY